MGKNWIGREDNTFDGQNVSYLAFPAAESAVQQMTGVNLPFLDMSRGKGSLLTNAVVLGEGITRRMAQPAMPEAENALVPQPPASADKIRELRDLYMANRRASAARGKSFYPSQE